MAEIDLRLASASAQDCVLLEQYDRATGRWKVPLDGPFWKAIEAAHKAGLTGAGKRLVIIDAMPDVSIPALSNIDLHKLVDDVPHPHGTLVALLARTVAPNAEIVHFAICKDGKPQFPALIEAMSKALALDADTLCLSLGAVQTMVPGANDALKSFLAHADYIGAARYLSQAEGSKPCVKTCGFPQCLCELIAAHRQPKSPTLLCAAGNKADMFCPARAPEAISVGFQTERIWFEEGHEKRAWEQPNYVQSGLLDYTITQLEGAIGSSFSAPLVAGALALRETPRPVRDLLRPNEVSAMAQVLEKEVTGLTGHGQDVPFSIARQLATIYDKAFKPLGDVENFEIDATRQLEARLFYAATVVNKALFLKDCREWSLLDRAIKLFRWASWLMPWDPSPRANIASSLLSVAHAGSQMRMENRQIARLLLQAKTIFDELITLDGNNEAYRAGLRDTLNLIQKLVDSAAQR